MLEFINFSKTYSNGKRAVDNLSLKIHPGDIFGFIGHNGAGKTTAIRAAVGAMEFDEGEILIDGVSVSKDPVLSKRKIAYIPDNPNLFDYLTGIQYINFISDIYGVSTEERKNRINEYAEAFDIMNDLNSQISSYSHGMKQKISIIAALVHRPKLLILDEPFVGLDPKAAHTLKLYMKELCLNGGAIFFSTHVLEVAEKLCNRIAIIKNGSLMVHGETEKICGDGTLEDLFLELIG